MIKVLMVLLIYSSYVLAGWVSKDQFYRILEMDRYTDEIISVEPHLSKWKKYVRGLYLKESSLGLMSYSDRHPSTYYIKHNGKDVELESKFYFNTRKKYASIDAYYVIYQGYQKKVYDVPGEIVSVSEASLGAFMVRVPTVKEVISKLKLKKYYKYLNDDLLLVNKIINDDKFNLYITLKYLEHNYQYIISKGWSRPMARSIGKHNGGWGNFQYYDKVIRDGKYVDAAVKTDRWNILKKT